MSNWQRFKAWMGTFEATAILVPICIFAWVLFFLVYHQ